MKRINLIILQVLFTISSFISIAQPGANDPTFNLNNGFYYGKVLFNFSEYMCVKTSIIQSDGKILIGGDFYSYNGIVTRGIARLNTDGSIDSTFHSGLGGFGWINTIAIQSDGKIIIGGYFFEYNGIGRSNIARLNIDGSLDETFNPGYGANAPIHTLAIQSDGKILIGGEFTRYNQSEKNYFARLNADGSLDETFNLDFFVSTGETIVIQNDGKIIIGGYQFGIARLNTDGSLDSTFHSGLDYESNIHTIAIQSDGKILMGGHFISSNGNGRINITRLNADGSLDTTFNPGSGASFDINTIAIQSDGKILIGGEFTSYNGTSINRIARLNTDGSLDVTFNPGFGADNCIRTISIQSDGKIIIGGDFLSFNKYNIAGIARLNSDGVIDIAGVIGYINAIAIQSDGKIIVGGKFTAYNGTAKNHIARLNTDGSLDSTFHSVLEYESNIYTIAIQNDGKILIGGDFTSCNGTSINRIARLNTDGSLDVTFNPGFGADNCIRTIFIQSNGKILIGGDFTSYNGTTITRIARLNGDGSLDATFNPGSGAGGTVNTIAVQSDGKVIIGGNFTSFNGAAINYITRLNADGSRDATFNPGFGANATINTIAVQSDGKILIGGNFISYNGTPINRIARLNPNGSLDVTFNPGSGANNGIMTISIQSDGKIIIGGYFISYNGTPINRIARLDPNGSLDVTFNPGFGADYTVNTNSIQNDGKIIIGGDFGSYNGVIGHGVTRIESGTASTIKLDYLNPKVQISIYPNPSSGIFTLKINDITPVFKGTLKVYSVSGRVVFESVVNNLQSSIDLNNEANGIYLVHLITEQGTNQYKIVKQ